MEEKKFTTMLPDFKPEPKFQVGDKVKTYKGERLIQSHYGYSLINGSWMPIYICVPMNKKGEADKRSKNKKTNTLFNQFNEDSLSKI
jgi:hypothetical protein